MPQIEIRPALPLDLPILATLDGSFKTSFVWQMERMFEDGKMTISFREIRLPRVLEVDYPHSGDEIQECLRLSNVLVALLNNVPVGFIGIEERLALSTAWVTDMIVDPQFRRQGIGSELVMAAQELAARHKLSRIILEMQSKNYPTVQMAIKMGFDFCGYQDHYYTNRDIALFYASFPR